MGTKNIGDTSEKILVQNRTRIMVLLVYHNIMPPRKMLLRKTKISIVMANVQPEEEDIEGNLIVRIQSPQIVGVLGHTIWTVPIVVCVVLMDV